jgi:hypothetical protein
MTDDLFKARHQCSSVIPVLLSALLNAASGGAPFATDSCPDLRLTACSTKLGEKCASDSPVESIVWDPSARAYIIRGAVLGWMLNNPGVSDVNDKNYRIAISQDPSMPSGPVDRSYCEQGSSEQAICTAEGEVIYTQLYNDYCNGGAYPHRFKLVKDSVGNTPAVRIYFAGPDGRFSLEPGYLLVSGDNLRKLVRK